MDRNPSTSRRFSVRLLRLMCARAMKAAGVGGALAGMLALVAQASPSLFP